MTFFLFTCQPSNHIKPPGNQRILGRGWIQSPFLGDAAFGLTKIKEVNSSGEFL